MNDDATDLSRASDTTDASAHHAPSSRSTDSPSTAEAPGTAGSSGADEVTRPRGPAEETITGFLARAVPLVFIGWALGRWVGAGATAIGVLSTYRRPVTLVAWGAPLALVVAALATVIEVPINDDALRSSFALDRPTAARAGMVAALWVLVTVATLATRDRPRRTATPTPEPQTGSLAEPAAQSIADRARHVALRWGPMVALGAVALVAIGLLAPDPPTATQTVADNVRLGLGWGTTAPDGAIVIDGREPPLAVVVTAVAPGGSGLWTGIAGAAAAVTVALLIDRRRPGAPALIGGAAVALGLLVTRADLAANLAAALVAATLLLAAPKGRTLAAAALAGATFGGAVLALPVLGLALPFLVAAVTIDPRNQSVSVSHGLAATVSAVVVVAPWQRWVLERFATWSPASEMVLPLSSALAVLLVAVVAFGVEPFAARARPAR